MNKVFTFSILDMMVHGVILVFYSSQKYITGTKYAEQIFLSFTR